MFYSTWEAPTTRLTERLTQPPIWRTPYKNFDFGSQYISLHGIIGSWSLGIAIWHKKDRREGSLVRSQQNSASRNCLYKRIWNVIWRKEVQDQNNFRVITFIHNCRFLWAEIDMKTWRFQHPRSHEDNDKDKLYDSPHLPH